MTIWDEAAINRALAGYMSQLDAILPVDTGALRRSMLPVTKIAYMIPVSEEMLNPTPTPDEKIAQWRREAAEEASRLAARHAELLASTNPVVRELAEFHGPDDGKCRGCDFDGYEGEAPEWPCRTWELLDKTERET